MDYLKAWYNSTEITKCHTERRMAKECMANWSDYQKYLNSFYKWKDYPLLQENDDCVKNVYTQYYWN